VNIAEFRQSLSNSQPPAGIPGCVRALWHDAKGDWEKAHRIIQEIDDSTAAWIHAYLHRKEGDTGNADYWYSRAGKKRPMLTLEEEWEQITMTLL
jgi:hypothetical protein